MSVVRREQIRVLIKTAAQLAAQTAAMVTLIQHYAYTVNHIRKDLTLLFLKQLQPDGVATELLMPDRMNGKVLPWRVDQASVS